MRNRQNGINAVYYKRYIALRERPPLMSDYFMPSEEDIKDQDSLVIKKYRFRIDQNGFVIPSKKYAHPDLSIVFLGGSTTECMFVDEAKRFPYLAGCLLEKACHLKINSYNGGVAGSNSLNSLDSLLNKVLPLHPKIVVMMHNINDLSVLLYEKSYWNKNPYKRVIVTEDHGPVNLVRIMVKQFIPNLYRDLLQVVDIRKILHTAEFGDEFADIRNKKVTYDQTRIMQEFGDNLDLFINICQDKHIIPVLMTMPSRFTEKPDPIILQSFKRANEAGLKYQDYRRMFDSFNDIIRHKAREHHILLIDLARDIPPTRQYMYDPAHYTAQGSEKIAAIVAAHLQPLVCPGVQPPKP